MLNKKNERELAYVVSVTDVLPMDADRLECVRINGWNCVCGKGDFKKGDLAVFFEIDSLLPEVKPFTDIEFLKAKHFKIKSQKIRGVISQGLLVPITQFEFSHDVKEGDFLTSELGVTYYVKEDNSRKKINPNEKYNKMAQRHKELFKKPFFRWMMRRGWGRKILFVFFGKKNDKPLQFPTKFEFVHRTDEERVENIPWILEDKSKWIKTCKLDGTSATYILERKPFNKFEFYVTSRNVRQKTPDQKNFHSDAGIETNVYWDMAYKYRVKNFLMGMLEKHPSWKYVCLQGEIVGPNIQGNPHRLNEVKLFGFNLIDSESGRWNSLRACDYCYNHGLEWVPIVDSEYILPDDFEEFKLSADGPCDLRGSQGLREGFVYRSYDGKKSFKNVSRKYLLELKE